MNEEYWWKLLEEQNFDFQTFSIFGDWLEEKGLHYQVIRLIVNKQYKPELYHYDKIKIYEWWNGGFNNDEEDKSIIPEKIYNGLTKHEEFEKYIGHRSYYSELEAYQDFVRAGSLLERMR